VWTLRIMLYILLFCIVVCTTMYEFICVYIEPMTYWSPYWGSLWQTNELGIAWVAFPFTTNNTTNTHYVDILHPKIIFWKSPFYSCLWACLQISCKFTCKFPKAAQVGTLLTLVLVVFLATSSTNAIVYIFI
jgi:hypothetical protein